MHKFIFPVNKRLCVHFPTLIPSVPQAKIDIYLKVKRYEKKHVDIINLAREQIGKKYHRGAKISENPDHFDCSSLIKWLYGQKGIYIPRISIDQKSFGTPVPIEQIKPGDLVFTEGSIPYYTEDNEDNRFGHVGIYTGEGVVHARSKAKGITEDPLDSFLNSDFSGIVRIHDNITDALTLIIPEKDDIEYDWHLRWRILGSMKGS